jgi:hypothetical protein
MSGSPGEPVLELSELVEASPPELDPSSALLLLLLLLPLELPSELVLESAVVTGPEELLPSTPVDVDNVLLVLPSGSRVALDIVPSLELVDETSVAVADALSPPQAIANKNTEQWIDRIFIIGKLQDHYGGTPARRRTTGIFRNASARAERVREGPDTRARGYSGASLMPRPSHPPLRVRSHRGATRENR